MHTRRSLHSRIEWRKYQSTNSWKTYIEKRLTYIVYDIYVYTYFLFLFSRVDSETTPKRLQQEASFASLENGAYEQNYHEHVITKVNITGIQYAAVKLYE